MTGTDLCVNKPQSVLVIFEPPCTLHNQRQNENITGMKYSLIFKVQQSQFQIKLETVKVNGENTLKEPTLKEDDA